MPRLRFLTAGESHGPALVATIEGLPAGLRVEREAVERELFRRRLGYGRSPRMDFEVDKLEFLGGLRHGVTLGSPLAMLIHNTEWPKWVDAMDPEARDDLDEIRQTGRGKKLTQPRPGHADLVAALKYGYDDVRDALERASARETASRVAIGTACKALLAEVGITVVSHVVEIGGERLPDDGPRPGPDDLERVDEDPVRTLDADTSQRMRDRIDRAHDDNDTLGGVVEVIAHGLPPGLGSHVHAERKLDARLAGAALSVQAMKGVEFGLGFAVGSTPGSEAHDEIGHDGTRYTRLSNRAGGHRGRHVQRRAAGHARGHEAAVVAATSVADRAPRHPRARHRHHPALRRLRGAAGRRGARARRGLRARRRAAREDRRRPRARGHPQPAGLPRRGGRRR